MAPGQSKMVDKGRPAKSKMVGKGRVLCSGKVVKSGKAVKSGRSQPDAAGLDDDNPPNGEDSDDYSDDEDFDEGSDEDSDDEDSDDEDSDEEDSDDEDSDEEVSDDSDSKSMAEEDHDDDLDYIEVKQVGGKYIKLKAAKATQNDDDEVQSKVMKDERFETNGKRGGARLAMVIVRAEAKGKQGYDKVFDMSDEAVEKASSHRWQMIPCKRGTYKTVKGEGGKTKYSQLTKRQIDQFDVDDEPCTCVICAARARNAIEALPVGSSRTRRGKKDSFAKYGPGKTLGSK